MDARNAHAHTQRQLYARVVSLRCCHNAPMFYWRALCGERQGLWRPLEASADRSIFPRVRGVSFTQSEEPPPRSPARSPCRTTEPIRYLSRFEFYLLDTHLLNN